ncbi:MAG: glycoside hydrolase domain-containing protein [Bacteroidota bacterium]
MQPHSSFKVVLQSCVSLLLIAALFPASLDARALRTGMSGPDHSEEPRGMRAFRQVAPGKGWLLLGEALYWTDNDGTEWRDITPAAPGGARIEDAVFIDASRGWALLGDPGSEPGAYRLAATTRAGKSWSIQRITLPALRHPAIPIGDVHMGWLDTRFGWLVLKFATGSNFSAGVLFVTEDGGRNWHLRDLPLGEAVLFADPHTGWIAGGPAGDQLFKTADGGKTWTPKQVTQGGARILAYSLPKSGDGGAVLLPAIALEAGRVSADLYRSNDHGGSWRRAARVPLGSDASRAALLRVAVLRPDSFLTAVADAGRISQMRSGRLVEYENEDGMAERIVSLSMSTVEAGWAEWVSAECSAGEAKDCSTEIRLLSTRDGGRHWKPISLPGGDASALRESFVLADKQNIVEAPALSAIQDPDTRAYMGHGFDTCQIPSLPQMQTWWNKSPYSAVNLYIGGSSRACDNEVLSASYVSQLNAQGWRFIPTWVGPQAACSWYPSRMSWDPATAYYQGVSQANQALNVAANLGLTGADKSGTVIYYDLEAYNFSDANCRAAANAFISGWVHKMHAQGNLGAAYGASCGSAVTDWNSLANIPDALWVANWYGNAGTVSFDRTASVWGAYCLSDALWSSHQRLRQYAGGHYETWGGLTLEIDSSVLDGPVTVPDGTAGLLAPSRPRLLGPGNGATLPRGSNTWLSWKTTGQTCVIHVWGANAVDITSGVNCSQFRLGVRRGGTYFWQVKAKNSAGSTQGPIWRFNIRPYGISGLGAEVMSATRVKLTWTLSADDPDYIDGYNIYADGLMAGTAPKGSTTFTVTNLSCNTLHSFYVTAVRQGVQSSTGKPASAGTPSCAPLLLSPSEGALTPSLRPRFVWGAVADAAGYQLQVSLTQDFSAPVINKSLVSTAYSTPADLAADTVYYWRARASGPFGDGDWANPVSFRTGNPPSIPVLLAPAPGETLSDYTPRFDWADVTLPEGTSLHHYLFRLSTDKRFKTLLYNKAVWISEFTPLSDLPAGTTFYWEVRAVNTLNQYSAWSEIRSFSTASIPASPPPK